MSPGASPEAVKRAYKRLAKRLHPDVCADADADARFAAVCEAYNALASERGTLANVGTEAWRMKWSDQLRVMREVERGATAVNVRRRRVARAATQTETRGAAHDGGTDASWNAREDAVGTRVRKETIEELVEDMKTVKHMYVQPVGKEEGGKRRSRSVVKQDGH